MNNFTQMISGNPVLLAPMAGINDAPFRSICKEMGAGLTYTEMISAASIVYQGTQSNVQELLDSASNEVPHAVQLFGSDPAMIADAAQRILDERVEEVALFDLNMGCPVPKVVNKGEGSALMRDPAQAARIVSALVDAVPLPVTVKFRSGWSTDTQNAVDFAKCMEDAGAAGICVHPRTRGQFYKGVADWSVIADVKKAVDIPVVGSGDIFSQADIHNMTERTGVDAVMVARGAQGNPWIFSGVEPTFEQRLDMARRHAYLLRDFVGDERACRRMRKHVMWYTHGLPGSTHLRGYVNKTIGFDDLIELIDTYQKRLGKTSGLPGAFEVPKTEMSA